MQGAPQPVARSEVAAFVDFENIRYSSINSFGREPDPIAWRDMALKYGLMAVARAYADFDQHPPQVRMRLDVAGFEAQHYPAKRSADGMGREKIQSRADLNFVIDVINTALTRPDIQPGPGRGRGRRGCAPVPAVSRHRPPVRAVDRRLRAAAPRRIRADAKPHEPNALAFHRSLHPSLRAY
jgi:hypothetical protein